MVKITGAIRKLKEREELFKKLSSIQQMTAASEELHQQLAASGEKWREAKKLLRMEDPESPQYKFHSKRSALLVLKVAQRLKQSSDEASPLEQLAYIQHLIFKLPPEFQRAIVVVPEIQKKEHPRRQRGNQSNMQYDIAFNRIYTLKTHTQAEAFKLMLAEEGLTGLEPDDLYYREDAFNEAMRRRRRKQKR